MIVGPGCVQTTHTLSKYKGKNGPRDRKELRPEAKHGRARRFFAWLQRNAIGMLRRARSRHTFPAPVKSVLCLSVCFAFILCSNKITKHFSYIHLFHLYCARLLVFPTKGTSEDARVDCGDQQTHTQKKNINVDYTSTHDERDVREVRVMLR